MTLQGAVGGDMLVSRSICNVRLSLQRDAIQQYEQFRVEKAGLTHLLLAGRSQPLT